MLRQLRQEHPPINSADKREEIENTSIHLAAQNGHEHVVRLLLATGANVDSVNENNETALHLAAQNGHIDVVRLLLAAGANILMIEKIFEFTALHLAAQNGHRDVVIAIIKCPDITTTLLGEAIYWATENGHQHVVRAITECPGIRPDLLEKAFRVVQAYKDLPTLPLSSPLPASDDIPYEGDSSDSDSEGDGSDSDNKELHTIWKLSGEKRGAPKCTSPHGDSLERKRTKADSDPNANILAKSETEAVATTTPEGANSGKAVAGDVAAGDTTAQPKPDDRTTTSQGTDAAAETAETDKEAPNSLEERHTSSVANATNPFIGKMILTLELSVESNFNDQRPMSSEKKELAEVIAEIDQIINGDAYFVKSNVTDHREIENPPLESEAPIGCSGVLDLPTHPHIAIASH